MQCSWFTRIPANVILISVLIIFHVIVANKAVLGLNTDDHLKHIKSLLDFSVNEFNWSDEILQQQAYDEGKEDIFEDNFLNEIHTEFAKMETEEEDVLPKGSILVKPSYPYAPNSMRIMAAIEAEIYSEISKYIHNMNLRISLMQKYVEDYEESLISGPGRTLKKQQHAVIANPFIFHRMMRRLSIDFVDIIKTFELYNDEQFLRKISDLNTELIFPNVEEDYTQSLNSLLRIQKYNNYDTYEFSNGKLEHLQSNVSLNSIHAAELGIQAGLKNEAAMSVEWFEVALRKIDEEEHDGYETEYFRERVQQYLEIAVQTHDLGMKDWETSFTKDLSFTEEIGNNYGPHLPKREKISETKKKQAKIIRNVTEYGFHTRTNFLTLCSGESLQSESEKSELYCWYETKKHPYMAINPFKMELLNKVPPMIQIYEVLYEKAINNIINKATPVLKRSTVINVKDPKASDVSDVRTSAQAWLHSSDYPFFEKIHKTVEVLTGLNVIKPMSSEMFQVASYGTSHHYDEHLDALLDERRTETKGDRIATFMIYLSNVEVGGKTAFPTMGTAANPVAGSAVFWHNLKRNGVPDKRTWHGGCPVVHGIKWVANKWILMHQNWNKRKCSLDPEE